MCLGTTVLPFIAAGRILSGSKSKCFGELCCIYALNKPLTTKFLLTTAEKFAMKAVIDWFRHINSSK